ncbi:ATP-binding cassette domain-containing protein [Sphingobium sp. AN558]|uniref:ATP-binding cassette domain-containing protein n=1 Tax=Sphingobium sp. AN558 TaxID=3133442 RepID=UPI0030BD6310
MGFDIDISGRAGERRIAFQCRDDGGLVALAGPSGVGKSSVLNMVAGLLRPERGHIRIGGQTLFDSFARIDLSSARRRAGYVFQDRRLFPHMRVRANLMYGRREGALVTFDEVLAFLGIGHLLDRWPATLSGGETQRVAIGRALLSAPDFLLLDEPLSSLDPPRKAEIQEAIDQIRSRIALPILYVTHDAAEAERLSAQIVVMG